MSKAFTRETDGDDEDDGIALPPLPVGGKNYITPAGYARLRAELLGLMDEERPKVVEAVHWAAKNGDRSENGDYLYGKKRLREIDRRIRFLTKRLEIAEVTDPSAAHHRAGEPGRAMGLRQRRRRGANPARLPRDVQPQLARLAHQGHRRQPRAAGAGDGAVRHGAALIPFRDRNDMNLVIPAKAGIQTTRAPSAWIPAFAGMTMVNVSRWNRNEAS